MKTPNRKRKLPHESTKEDKESNDNSNKIENSTNDKIASPKPLRRSPRKLSQPTSSSRKKRSNKDDRISSIDGDDNNDDNSKPHHEMESIVDLEAGTVTFSTAAVRAHLTCQLCGGLYRNPFTISECLHTFCKSCIIFAFQDIGMTSCPTCDVSLSPDPFKYVMSDRTLQELVDKLFPDLNQKDLDEEKVYWDMVDKGFTEEKAFDFIQRLQKEKEDEGGDDDDEKESSNNTINEKSPSKFTRSHSTTNTGEVEQNKNGKMLDDYIPPHDQISLRLYPSKEGRSRHQLPPLAKPLLQTSGKLKIIHLKKYIIKHLKLDSTLQESIHIRCNGDHVGDELSLTFISKTRWLDPTKNLTLIYSLDSNSISM